jgi:hypothetical protein
MSSIRFFSSGYLKPTLRGNIVSEYISANSWWVAAWAPRSV